MDPKRQKITIEQANRIFQHLQQQLNQLKESARNSLTTQFQNIQSMAGGMESAEFNLRAQQKVINGLAMAVDRLFQAMQMELEDVQMMTPKDEEGNEVLSRRVDWAFYHGEVQKDKAEIARLQQEEADRAKAELDVAKEVSDESQISEELEKIRQAAIEAGNDPDEVVAEAEKLLRESKAVADETGKMMRGEPFDETVIAEAQRKIAEDEDAHGDLPEGATIFGGG